MSRLPSQRLTHAVVAVLAVLLFDLSGLPAIALTPAMRADLERLQRDLSENVSPSATSPSMRKFGRLREEAVPRTLPSGRLSTFPGPAQSELDKLDKERAIQRFNDSQRLETDRELRDFLRQAR